MMNFLRYFYSYFINRPWLFVSILSVLALFLIATLVLSLVCPPAALAIGIGACSLIGVILPLIAAGLFFAFMVTFGLSTTARFFGMFHSSTDGVVSVLSGLTSVSEQTADSGKNISTTDQHENPSEVDDRHFDSVFAEIKNTDREHVKSESQAFNL